MSALPSPNGTFHAISPRLRSMATRLAYGGLISGIGPRRLCAAGTPPGWSRKIDPDAPDDDLPPGNTSGGEDNTFDHPDSVPDPWDLLERMQEQGPPRYSSRVHSCPKLRYATIGHLLESLGVNLDDTAELSAGNLWRTSDQALGAPNYAARSRENLELTTASASKLFDIFAQAYQITLFVTMTYANYILFDDRSFIQILSNIVAGSTN